MRLQWCISSSQYLSKLDEFLTQGLFTSDGRYAPEPKHFHADASWRGDGPSLLDVGAPAMQGARIYRAALSGLSEPAQRLGTATLPVNHAQLRWHAVSAPALVPRLTRDQDGMSCPHGDFLSALFSPRGSVRQAKKKKPTISSQPNDDATTTQSSPAQTPGTEGQLTESCPLLEGQDGLWNDPYTQSESRDTPRHADERTRHSISAIIRTFGKTNHSPPEGISLEAWRYGCQRDSLYQQWGYIRHQCSTAEVLPARRAFKSWKIKLSHVLDPVNPSSWQWREQGKWLFELDTVTAMRKAWESRDQATRRQEWPLIMLSTMHLCPDKASMVLDATLDPALPGYAIHDVLLFIVQRFRLEDSLTIRERTTKADEMLDLASRIVEDMPAGHILFGQRTFGLLARKFPSEQADELYTILLRNGFRFHANTLLQFASKFASDWARKASAYDILKELADAGLNLNDAKPASAITSLLHCKMPRDGDEYEARPFSPTEALQSLIERGFSPNVINATALLDSLCQRSEVEEAMRLALLFAKCGIQPDTKTWVTVFRGAKKSLNVDNVIKALEVAKAANAPSVDVLNNLLHTIFFFAEAESRERHLPPPWVLPLFTPMLHIYAKKFDLEPLQGWLPDKLPVALAQEPRENVALGAHGQAWTFTHSVVPVVDKFFSDCGQSRLQPNATTIATMLRSYIKSLSNPHDLKSFYGFFKSLLEEEGERGKLARELIEDQGSLIHDAFILAMTGHPSSIRQALQVFDDMLRGHLDTDSASGRKARVQDGRDASTAPCHPCPSVLTFNILLRGLKSHGEHILAEQVVRFMDELGVKATITTWNTLIKGYASSQNVERTVTTLQDMEADGFHPDMFTFKAFAELRDQGKALKMLQSIIDENKQKMMEEGSASVNRTEAVA